MKYSFVIATMVACCVAMPALQDRPTPINPKVLSESKPTEKPTATKDAKDDQSPQPFYPTALPAEVSHHISKRDHKPGHDDHTVAKPAVPEPAKKSPTPVSPENASLKPHPPPSSAIKLPDQKRNRRDAQKVDNRNVELPKPQTLPALTTHHDDNGSLKVQQGNNAASIGLHKPQTLPAAIHENEKHKRDAPAPFAVPHEQSKTPPQTSKVEELEKHDKKEEPKPTEPSHNPNVQVEDLSDHKVTSQHKLSASKHPHEFHPHSDATTDVQKPVTVGDIQQKPNTNKLTVESSTEHPVIRPKPVPVSELFSRHQDN